MVSRSVSRRRSSPSTRGERDAAVTLRRLPRTRALDLTDAALSHVPDFDGARGVSDDAQTARNHLGFLPAHLSDCVALRVLHLDENRLSFLPDLSKMTRLEDLRARANRLVTSRLRCPNRPTSRRCTSAEPADVHSGRVDVRESRDSRSPSVGSSRCRCHRGTRRDSPTFTARGTRQVSRAGGVYAREGTTRCCGTFETSPRRNANDATWNDSGRRCTSDAPYEPPREPPGDTNE